MPRGRPRKADDALVKSAEMIGWALGGLEREIASTRQRLDTLLAQATKLRQRLGGAAAKSVARAAGDGSSEPQASPARRARRKMSAEARKRISENMRKRWAERKKKGLKRL